ncbi:MAG: hypothetical protein ACLVJB_04935 [Christensenellales bacterium]
MEKLLIRGGRVIDPANGVDQVADVLVEDGKIAAVGEGLSAEGAAVYDAAGKVVAPGFIDIHCHLRDPGQEYKEDIVSGTRAATAVYGGLLHANTEPVNDNAAVTRYIIEKAETQEAAYTSTRSARFPEPKRCGNGGNRPDEGSRHHRDFR